MPSSTTTTKSSAKKNHKPRRYLADDYEPHENDVLIGRGRRVELHNKKFRAMISAHLAAYYNAQTKATKSTIILRIFQQVKRGGGTGFVKQEASSRRWFAIEDSAARISIAQAFRDALSTEYKSSKQYKQQKRKEERGEGVLNNALMGFVTAAEDPPAALFAPPSFGRQISGDLPNHLCHQMPSLLPPRLVNVVSSDGRDLTRSSLEAILERATSVVNSVESESLLRNGCSAPLVAAAVPSAATEAPLSSSSAATAAPTSLQDTLQEQEDVLLLAGLEQALGSQMDLSSDPFEPTPLMEAATTNDLLFGDGDGDLMDAISMQLASSSSTGTVTKPQEAQGNDEEDVFKVFDSVPALDLKHALSA